MIAAGMKRTGLALVVLLLCAPEPAEGRSGVHPVLRNIASLCRGQPACVARQQYAMRQAMTFMVQKKPAVRKVELCNRNAARSRQRVDWIGFNNCIRNPRVGPRSKVRLW